MTTVGDAKRWLGAQVGFDPKMTRADRRRAARQLYRKKRPPKIDPKANALYLANVQAERRAHLEAAEAEHRATVELMRTAKMMTISEGA